MHRYNPTLFVLLAYPTLLMAEPNRDLAYQLKASVAKVHVTTKTGGHGVGTGVVVAKDLVATNCHILANATGVSITKFGDNFTPIALKADWAHDLCILKFQYLDLKPVELGDSEHLQYEQAIFSIGFPGGPPKPQTNYGRIKALYPFEDSVIVRTNASFIMGASGSPVFDEAGKLIAISTFKSPGQQAYYYNIPVKWVKRLLDAPESLNLQTEISPFWDVPLEQRPYFMQVVLPYQHQEWETVQKIAQSWRNQSPSQAEPHYYLGLSQLRLNQQTQAEQNLKKALSLEPNHVDSLIALGEMADLSGKTAELAEIKLKLEKIDQSQIERLEAAIASSREAKK